MCLPWDTDLDPIADYVPTDVDNVFDAWGTTRGGIQPCGPIPPHTPTPTIPLEPELPSTGGTVQGLLVTGFLLLVAGGLLLIARRRH